MVTTLSCPTACTSHAVVILNSAGRAKQDAAPRLSILTPVKACQKLVDTFSDENNFTLIEI
ncbi:hypothetical protein TSMEX_004014 [Taenia solium]|eukprot:TsM_000300200 transcript=TsM_000300200 gene=TsM_000300200